MYSENEFCTWLTNQDLVVRVVLHYKHYSTSLEDFLGSSILMFARSGEHLWFLSFWLSAKPQKTSEPIRSIDSGMSLTNLKILGHQWEAKRLTRFFERVALVVVVAQDERATETSPKQWLVREELSRLQGCLEMTKPDPQIEPANFYSLFLNRLSAMRRELSKELETSMKVISEYFAKEI